MACIDSFFLYLSASDRTNPSSIAIFIAHVDMEITRHWQIAWVDNHVTTPRLLAGTGGYLEYQSITAMATK